MSQPAKLPIPPASTGRAHSFLLLAALVPVLWGLLVFGTTPTFEDPRVLDEIAIFYPAEELSAPSGLELAGEWEVRGSDVIPAGDNAVLIHAGPEGPWRTVHLSLTGDESGEWGVRFAREFQRATILGIHPGSPEAFPAEQLPGDTFSWEPLRVEIFPRGDGDHRLNRVMIRFSAEEPGTPGPHLPGIVMGGFLPLLLASFFLYAGRRTERQAVRVGAVFGSVVVIAILFQTEFLPYLWAAATAFALGGASGALFKSLAFRRAGNGEEAARFFHAFQWLAMAAIVGFALQARWVQLGDTWTRPLSPDALGYLRIAVEGTFYQTTQEHAPWIREPLFPAWLRFWFSLAPASAMSARVAGIFPSVAVVVLAFLLGRKLFNPWVGLLASAFLALNGYLAITATEGLRDDLLTALFLALACVPAWLGGEKWTRAVLFGFFGAGLGLLRVNALFFVLLVGGWEAWRRRWHPGEIVLALAIAVLPVLPHLAHNARVSGGDWLYSSNVHTRYYLNLLHLGEEGFPATMEEWRADPYAGGVVGSSVLLVEPTPLAAALRTLQGGFMLFVKDFPHWRLFEGRLWLMAFGLPGLYALLRRREAWWFHFWTVLFLLPVAVVAAIRLDTRLALPGAPAILFVWGAGVYQTAVWIRMGVRHLRDRRNTP